MQLLGRRVLQRERAIAGGGGVAGVELLGDAEVEQLDPAFAVDQQVGWLQVAVDDQVAVGMGHGIQHLREQLHALAQVQPVRVAPLVDRHAVHALHDEVGIALLADAAIEQCGDVGVAQAGQQLAFAQEAFARGRGVGHGADQLERRLLVVGTVGAFHGVDRAHAAAAEDRDHPPGAERPTEQSAGVAIPVRRAALRRPGEDREGRVVVGVRRQHRLEPGAQRVVACAQGLQPGLALAGRQVHDLFEDLQRPPPQRIGVVHGAVSAASSARALRRSRRTV